MKTFVIIKLLYVIINLEDILMFFFPMMSLASKMTLTIISLKQVYMITSSYHRHTNYFIFFSKYFIPSFYRFSPNTITYDFHLCNFVGKFNVSTCFLQILHMTIIWTITLCLFKFIFYFLYFFYWDIFFRIQTFCKWKIYVQIF